MKKLFDTIFASLRAQFASLWNRLRRWTSPVFWRTRVFTALRRFFVNLFDMRPRHKKDYYGVFRWLVSKRLAFAAVVVLGVLCIAYLSLTLPKGFFTGNTATTIRTYRYDAIPLKFYTGTVRILAADNHLVYLGQVKGAHCSGKGTLYHEDGGKIYEGQFENDMYNGDGTLYYPDGTVRYQGSFQNNLYQGKGKAFRPNGTPEYEGEYDSGLRNGEGTLYNAAANPIFTGAFQLDRLLYNQLLGKPTTQVAQMYTGASQVYSSDREYAVAMEEIGAVYAAADGSRALDGNYTVRQVCILADSFPAPGGDLTTINQLTAYFGEPDYFGASWVDLTEAAAINLLVQKSPGLLEPVTLNTSAQFDGVYTVSGYDTGYQTYLYTYLRDGLLYTFYTAGAGQERFAMYAIETT